MKRTISAIALITFGAVATIGSACGGATAASRASAQASGPVASAREQTKDVKAPTPLKEAKLNIEHNATAHDTGFQGAIDSEGWKRLDITGPEGIVLSLQGRGELGRLGLTELFFETVEPANADVSIAEMLDKLPEGNYKIAGPGIQDGVSTGWTSGTAWLTHDIPEGPVLLSPAAEATVPITGLVARWGAVNKTITGKPIKIIAYQLIIERDTPPDPNMIGKFGLSMYLPPSVTSIAVPDGFLEPGRTYNWEVLAIEVSGNQTLSSGVFRTP